MDQPLVGLKVFFLEIQQKPSTPAYQLEQTSPGMEILFVGLQMPGQLIDSIRHDGDLDLGGAGVLVVTTVVLDDFCFFCLSDHFAFTSIL